MTAQPLFHIRYRQDATGYVARYAGQVASTEPMPYALALTLRDGCPNASQMEVVPAS